MLVCAACSFPQKVHNVWVFLFCWCARVCVAAPGERRGVWSLPRGAVRLSDWSVDQTESQAAHQSHQGEGVQAEGETGSSRLHIHPTLLAIYDKRVSKMTAVHYLFQWQNVCQVCFLCLCSFNVIFCMKILYLSFNTLLKYVGRVCENNPYSLLGVSWVPVHHMDACPASTCPVTDWPSGWWRREGGGGGLSVFGWKPQGQLLSLSAGWGLRLSSWLRGNRDKRRTANSGWWWIKHPYMKTYSFGHVRITSS